MTKKEANTVTESLQAYEKRLDDMEERMCEQRAYIHALEALTIHIMTDHGVDEEAVKASLGSLLHTNPQTGQTAQNRADYLINFKRLDKSAALYSSDRGQHRAK